MGYELDTQTHVNPPAHPQHHRFESRRDDPFWLSCLFAPPGAALRYALALWMARSAVSGAFG